MDTAVHTQSPVINPAKILDQLRHVTPAAIQEAIQFCQKNIAGIRERAKQELQLEKEEIKRLRRVAKLIDMGVELDHDGRAKVAPVAAHKPRPDSDEGGGRLSDRIAAFLKTNREASFKSIAESLAVTLPAVRMAVHRSGARFEIEGNKISLGRAE